MYEYCFACSLTFIIIAKVQWDFQLFASRESGKFNALTSFCWTSQFREPDEDTYTLWTLNCRSHSTQSESKYLLTLTFIAQVPMHCTRILQLIKGQKIGLRVQMKQDDWLNFFATKILHQFVLQGMFQSRSSIWSSNCLSSQTARVRHRHLTW